MPLPSCNKQVHILVVSNVIVVDASPRSVTPVVLAVTTNFGTVGWIKKVDVCFVRSVFVIELML